MFWLFLFVADESDEVPLFLSTLQAGAKLLSQWRARDVYIRRHHKLEGGTGRNHPLTPPHSHAYTFVNPPTRGRRHPSQASSISLLSLSYRGLDVAVRSSANQLYLIGCASQRRLDVAVFSAAWPSARSTGGCDFGTQTTDAWSTPWK